MTEKICIEIIMHGLKRIGEQIKQEAEAKNSIFYNYILNKFNEKNNHYYM